MSKDKLKIAFYWAASCGGCEIAVLDINEKILDVVANSGHSLLASSHGHQIQRCGSTCRTNT